MIRINQCIYLALTSLAFMACNKDKEADSPDSVEDYSDDRDGTNYESTEDPEEALEETEEEIEDAADEVEDEVDGDPTTD